MAKPSGTQNKSLTKLVFFGAITLVGGWIYSATGAPDATPAKKVAATSKSSTGPSDQYTKLDYTVKYEPLKDSAKNVFQPLIYKANAVDPLSGGIPLGLTEGESWMYTGKVEVNGQTQALLENSATGENVFLSVGQHWKKAKIKSVSDYQIVLTGDDGSDVSVPMGEPAASKKSIDTLPPVQPPVAMMGNIGQLNVGPPDMSAQQDNGAGNANGGRGRGRGRGRGGNGNGNGNAGFNNGN